MVRGLYTSALGMTVQMKRMDVLTNNIANSDTTGYKRDFSITQSFTDILNKRLDDYSDNDLRHEKPTGMVSLGVFVDSVGTDFSNGSFRSTGGPLDLAISGEGFFAVSVTRNGVTTEQYTRDGSFTRTAEGKLVTKEGNTVLGENGEIILPEGEIIINDQGFIIVNGAVVDRLKLVGVDNMESLRKTGDNLYNVTAETNLGDFGGSLIQGYLENSNANPVREMVEMIAVMRTYEANQRMITTRDTVLGKAVNDIARK